MISILKNENVKMFGVNTNDNDITFKLKLSKPLVDLNGYNLFSILYDFHDSIRSILVSDEKENYVFKDINSNDFIFLKSDNVDILTNYIHSLNDKHTDRNINYDYYDYSNGVYLNKITDNISIKVDYNKNKISLIVDNDIFNKQIFEEWS